MDAGEQALKAIARETRNHNRMARDLRKRRDASFDEAVNLVQKLVPGSSEPTER